MNRVKIAGVVAAIIGMLGGIFVVASPANANTYGCFSWGCNGLNPSGLCDDGITVASKSLKDGLIELRYSRSCKSNWGRFTPWRKTAWAYASSRPSIQIFARVTAWNPGRTSFQTAHAYAGVDNFGSSWSQMTDGKPTACTGVELYTYSEGWHGNSESSMVRVEWGPCY